MQYPRHVALIPDWNRTWARERWKLWIEWHLEWLRRCEELATYIFESTDIDVFTVWWLSTENFKNRTQDELNYLFGLYKRTSEDMGDVFDKNHVNFRVVWDMEGLPDNLVMLFNEKMKEFNYPDSTKTFVMAINYWWQDEILRAVKKLNDSGDEISKENLEKYMDFWWFPTVDLVIRTKQKLAKRLSWFMLWWIWYAQLYFTDVYCPDFTVEEFEKAIVWWNDSLGSQNFWK